MSTPVAVDIAAFLDWAYGSAARKTFVDGLFQDQRPGQSFMNVLRIYDPESYVRLAGSIFDPFYVDSKIPAALDKLTSK